MDRINKFLQARQKKNTKTISYKNQKFNITKDDLKKVREYKSGKCMDSAIKQIPNRIITDSKLEPIEAKPKKDMSDYYNSRLREHYLRNPKPKTVTVSKNEIKDIWEDEDFSTLRNYTQEWTYSIKTQYDGPVENLHFSKEYLDEELRRVYLKQFRPVDPKEKAIRDILPKLPEVSEMKPFPEDLSLKWEIEGRKTLFGFACSVKERRIVLRDLEFNKVILDREFETEIYKTACYENNFIFCSKNEIYFLDLNKQIENNDSCGQLENAMPVIQSAESIRDIYIDESFIAYLTAKNISIHHATSFEQLKLLKLKGDSPHTIKIVNDTVYASTHKGILVDTIERSEIKNLGYVIDFDVQNGRTFAINNLGRLLNVDSNLQVVSTTQQNEIGLQVRYHPVYELLAVLFTSGIGLYKVIKGECIPINTIPGKFRSISWNKEMPWIYAATKERVELYT